MAIPGDYQGSIVGGFFTQNGPAGVTITGYLGGGDVTPFAGGPTMIGGGGGSPNPSPPPLPPAITGPPTSQPPPD
jgi:hypothetical protein